MVLHVIVLSLSYHCFSSGRVELPVLYDYIIEVNFCFLLCSPDSGIPFSVQKFCLTYNIFILIMQAADTQVISDYVRYFLHQHT
jgi:hypothetical protein